MERQGFTRGIKRNKGEAQFRFSNTLITSPRIADKDTVDLTWLFSGI